MLPWGDYLTDTFGSNPDNLRDTFRAFQRRIEALAPQWVFELLGSINKNAVSDVVMFWVAAKQCLAPNMATKLSSLLKSRQPLAAKHQHLLQSNRLCCKAKRCCKAHQRLLQSNRLCCKAKRCCKAHQRLLQSNRLCCKAKRCCKAHQRLLQSSWLCCKAKKCCKARVLQSTSTFAAKQLAVLQS